MPKEINDYVSELIVPPRSELERRFRIEGQKFGNKFRSLSVAIGTTTLSFQATSQVDLPTEASLTIRVLIGCIAGAVYHVLDGQAIKYFRGEELKTILKNGDNARSALALSNEAVKFIAFWSFLPTVAATAYDYLENHFLARDVNTLVKEADFDTYNASALNSIVKTLHEEIIRNTKDGNLTTKSMAEMAIVFDGHKIQWNPIFSDEFIFESEYNVEFEGASWTIKSINLENWVIVGPHDSWWIGTEASGRTILEELDTDFLSSSKKDVTLSQFVHQSPLFNEKPAVYELAKSAKFEPVFPDFESRPSSLLPLEYGQKWREETMKKIIQTYDINDAALEASVWKSYEDLFGISELDNPNSYAYFFKTVKEND